MVRSNWRDCQDWRSDGLPLSTTSNEAAKLYDASITQYVGWYDDTKLGGLTATLEKMLTSDPDFVMGHVINNGLDLMGTGRSPDLDQTFKNSLDRMFELASSSKITKREQLHVQALQEWSQGNMNTACTLWEDILFQTPLDMLAIKFAHDAYFYLGRQSQMLSSVVKASRTWTQGMPLYGYLKGMQAFGHVETQNFEAAERVALEGLEINPYDGWSTHAAAHVYELTGRYKKGIHFMGSTVKYWETCGMLACHNYWHWALFHIEKGEYRHATDIYDSEVFKRSQKSDAMLDIVDACSLLFRLEMEGADVSSRWQDLHEVVRPHLDDHLTVFNDVHMIMACVGVKQQETTENFLESVQKFLLNGKGDQRKVMELCGDALLKAVKAYADEDYSACVEIMKPIRYKIIKIGGSDAQRDVFNLLLINAALKSGSEENLTFARHMLFERKALRTDSPMTERLMARAMSNHMQQNDTRPNGDVKSNGK